MMSTSRLAGGFQWLRPRRLELAILVLGVLLRASFAWTNHVSWAFDQSDHWQVARWILAHGRLPGVDTLRESFHPPLFYVLGALLLKLGLSLGQIIFLPILCGTLRLGLLWAGFELYLSHSRSARVASLALVAILPASVHIDGIVHPEALNGLWTALGMFLGALALRRRGLSRWRAALAAGGCLGLALLTKISGSVVLLSILCGAILELLLSRDSWTEKLRAALPFAAMLGLCVLLCGWFYARNVREHHKLFLTSFDLPFEEQHVAKSNRLPYLERRSLGYLFGWDSRIFVYPFHPTSIEPYPQFFPVAVASTFSDYWKFSFSGLSVPERGGPSLEFDRIVRASQFAVVGGTVIWIATSSAWLWVFAFAFRKRRFDELALLLVPLLTVASALHFAIANPVDYYGVVKGIYMQFGAPSLYALFGLSVAWTLAKPDRWPLFVALLSAFWCVTAYTMYCRFRLPLLPYG